MSAASQARVERNVSVSMAIPCKMTACLVQVSKIKPVIALSHQRELSSHLTIEFSLPLVILFFPNFPNNPGSFVIKVLYGIAVINLTPRSLHALTNNRVLNIYFHFRRSFSFFKRD